MTDQVFEEGRQLGRTGLLVGAQLGQAPGEERVLQRPDAFEGAAPVGRDAHPGAAPIGDVGDRVTMPASLKLATIRVMVGGCTCSVAANSPSVGLPRRFTAPNADAWAGDSPASDS